MALVVTKKTRTILLIVLALLLVGGGGFLIWTLTQQESVAPEDSEAGGVAPGDGCCLASWVEEWGRYICPTSTWSSRCDANPSDSVACYCKDKGNMINCDGQRYCVLEGQDCTNCGYEPGEDEECLVGSDCPACKFPKVGYCSSNRTCTCIDYTFNDGHTTCNYGKSFSCNANCPTGEIECTSGESGCHEVRKNCLCPDCQNKTYDTILCKTAPVETNICENSKWNPEPTGTYESCSGVVATVEATDPDGIKTDSISVKVNGQTKTDYTVQNISGGKSITYSFKDSDCPQPGEYTILISWKDGLGNSGPECTVEASFNIVHEDEPYCGDGELNTELGEKCEEGDPTGVSCTWDVCDKTNCTCPAVQENICGDGILDTDEGEQCEKGDPNGVSCTWDVCLTDQGCICPEEQQNPDWTITKTATPECIVEEQLTYAKASYTVTVTNVGEGDGILDKIVDELDESVLEEYVKDISNEGVYSSGVITWDLEGDEEIFEPEESLQVTYSIEVPQEAFGIFDNRVTGYPSDGENFSDDESVELTCDIEEEPEEPEVPQTGIFDTVLGRIAFGVILILVGINWPNISRGIIRLDYSVKEQISNKQSKKFERKVVKDK